MSIYCGANSLVPKGKRRGTPEECLGMHQVRYYGVQPINIDDYVPKLSKAAKNKIISKLVSAMAILRTKIRRLEEDKKLYKNRDKIPEIEDKIKYHVNSIRRLAEAYEDFKRNS